MRTRRLGIIMNGVTGRMGTNQHLVRSVLAIRAQGGVALANGDRVMPDPILIGRNADKTAAPWLNSTASSVGRPTSTRRWPAKTTNCSLTPRPPRCARRCWKKAIAAGKHVYCEKADRHHARRGAQGLQVG